MSEQAKRDSFLAVTKSGIKFHMEQLKNTESRLDFLTDIFFLSEELRHEIYLSESDPVAEERWRNKIEAIRRNALGECDTDSDREETRNANTSGE